MHEFCLLLIHYIFNTENVSLNNAWEILLIVSSHEQAISQTNCDDKEGTVN
jgi:hypothetical protein